MLISFQTISTSIQFKSQYDPLKNCSTNASEKFNYIIKSHCLQWTIWKCNFTKKIGTEADKHIIESILCFGQKTLMKERTEGICDLNAVEACLVFVILIELNDLSKEINFFPINQELRIDLMTQELIFERTPSDASSAPTPNRAEPKNSQYKSIILKIFRKKLIFIKSTSGKYSRIISIFEIGYCGLYSIGFQGFPFAYICLFVCIY